MSSISRTFWKKYHQNLLLEKLLPLDSFLQLLLCVVKQHLLWRHNPCFLESMVIKNRCSWSPGVTSGLLTTSTEYQATCQWLSPFTFNWETYSSCLRNEEETGIWEQQHSTPTQIITLLYDKETLVLKWWFICILNRPLKNTKSCSQSQYSLSA